MKIGEKALERSEANATQTLLEAIQDKKRHAKMSSIIEHINDKEWEKLYQFIDMPLEKVPVKAWYGREMQTMDLTGDGDEEEISAEDHPRLLLTLH